ncbi:MAG: zinc ribbon domain-containing protein [Deltaproteobacteria bacterium]|nr:zinc ribbon domain-containing protein [Deltaproteobacteria bacterium]
MPTYEYLCESTGRLFEFRQSMTDDPLRECPECGGPVTRLVSGGSGVIHRGGQFPGADSGGSSRDTTRCGRGATCCGRENPCDSPPCGH